MFEDFYLSQEWNEKVSEFLSHEYSKKEFASMIVDAIMEAYDKGIRDGSKTG